MNKLMSFTLACCVLVAPVMAETDSIHNWYLGAGAGVSRLKPDTKNTGFSVSDSNDIAFRVFAGHDWTRHFSVEAYYADLGAAGISPYGEVEYQDFGVSGLYYFRDRINNRHDWTVYGNFGLGRMRNDSDLPYKRVNDTHVLLGAGIEYGITANLTLRLALDLYEEDAQFLSVNLLRRFEDRK